MFAIVMCLVVLRCTLTICSSVLCAFMVEGMSAVVKVMLSLMSVISPPPSLCVLSFLTVVYAGIFGVFEVLGEFGFLYGDDICLCVVYELFQFLYFVSDAVYVYL